MRRTLVEGILAFLVTIGFFTVIGALLARPFPLDNRDVLLVLLGSLGTQWTTTMQYYFGSSVTATKTVLGGQANVQSGAKGS